MMGIFNKQAPMLSPQLSSGAGGMMPTNIPSWLEGLFNPQPSQRQLPSAPWQTGMRAGSVGNQMGGLNNMYSNFAAPSPMPAPPPPMFGAPAGNSRAMMGPKPVGLF